MYSEAFYYVRPKTLYQVQSFSIYSSMTYFYALKRENFVNDKTITATCNTLAGFLKTLKQEPESAVSWFKQNEIFS